MISEEIEDEFKNFDDTFIRKIDKQTMVQDLEELYNKKFTWADEVLLQSLVTIHYKRFILKMDKQKYLDEIRDIENDTIKNDISDFMKTDMCPKQIRSYNA